MKRRITAAVLTVLSILPLFGCGGNARPSEPDPRQTGNEPVQTVSVDELREDMLAAAPSLPEMKTVSDGDEKSEALFSYLSDLDYDKVEHFFLVYSATGLADEIAVIAVKDPADAAEAKASLERHLSNRKQMYAQYQPDQVPRVENAEVFTKDQYVVLIVCDDAAAVKAAFIRDVE